MLSTKVLSVLLRSSRKAHQIRHGNFGVLRPPDHENYRNDDGFKRKRSFNRVEKKKSVEAETDLKSAVLKNVPRTSQMNNTRPILETTDPDERILNLISLNNKSMELWKHIIKTGMSGFRNVRFLTSARSSHDFENGRRYLQEHMDQLNPMELLEAARLLTIAAVCRRDEPDDRHLVERLLQRLGQLDNLPTNLKLTASILLRSLVNLEEIREEAATALLPSRRGDILHRKDILVTMSSLLLKNGMIDTFLSLTQSAPSSDQESDEITASDLFNSLEVGYWLLYAADRAGLEEKTRLLQWYLRCLVNYSDPIDHVDFLNLAVRFLGKTNVEIERTEPSQSGQLIPQKEFRLQIEKVPLEIDDLKAEFKQMMTEFSEQQASVTKEEMAELEADIADWKSRAEPGGAIVLDALNILHRGDISPFVRRLRRNHSNIFVISRKFTRPRLESSLWPPNTKKFFASDESEDDLMAIYAALEWGPDCFVLSNDRFKKHSDRLSDSGSKAFHDWYKKRNVRINHTIGAFAAPNFLTEKPRLVTSQQGKEKAILLPVLADTSLLPYYSFWLVRVPPDVTL